MEENQEELLKSFKKLEKKLHAEIKKMPSTIQDSNDTRVLKQRIRSYINQLNEIKKLLEEYESVANKIEKLANSKKNGEEISKAVVDFRPSDNTKPQELTTQEETNEIGEKDDRKKESNQDEEIVVDGKVVGVKKKKINKSYREM